MNSIATYPSDNVATEALNVVQNRGDNYGHPLDNFTDIATMWSVILRTPVTAEQVALCMQALKLCREVHKHQHDNLVDGVGYWLCLEELMRERERRDSEAVDRSPWRSKS